MEERFLNSTLSFLTEYDSRSIMHYDSYGNGAFTSPAMVKLNGSIIEPNTQMSDLDIATLNKMYPCENSCDHTNLQGKTSCHIQLHERNRLLKSHSPKDVLNPFFRQRFAFQNNHSRSGNSSMW